VTYVLAMKARAPASSANLGPGFDTLALALALHVEVDVQSAEQFTLRTEGEGSDIRTDRNHLAAEVVRSVIGHDRVAIAVTSNIPVGRGLGSSASLAVAAAAAAGADNPLAVAAAVDGHPENAAASVLGGLITSTMVNDHPVAARLSLDHDLRFVVLIPSRPLATARARQALPAQVPHADAAFNLGRMGILLAGLADHRLLVREATEDRLHQQARTPLFPESGYLIGGMVEAGALAGCWSGAGPSVLGICTAEVASRVRAAGEGLLAEAGVSGKAVVLDADHEGLVVEE
jgi:homoserine kinase